MVSLADFESHTLWGLIFYVQALSAPDVGLGPFYASTSMISLPFTFLLQESSSQLCLCPSLCGLSFMSLAVEDLFYRSSGHHQREFSMCSCSHGVSVGGGKLRIFLLFHLPLTMGHNYILQEKEGMGSAPLTLTTPWPLVTRLLPLRHWALWGQASLIPPYSFRISHRNQPPPGQVKFFGYIPTMNCVPLCIRIHSSARLYEQCATPPADYKLWE